MSLIEVRSELERRLSTVAGLRVYALPPESVTELPAAIIQPGQPLAEYDRTMAGGSVSYNFAVLVLTRSGDDAEAWKELAAYVAPAGPDSIKAAVEKAGLEEAGLEEGRLEKEGTAGKRSGVDWFRVVQAEGGGRTLYNKAAHWGVTFQVQGSTGG